MSRLAALALACLLPGAQASAQEPPAASPAAPQTPALPAAAGSAAAAVAAAAPALVLETSEGTIVIRLRPDLAPLHVKHVLRTARAGRYDGTVFHRVIKNAIIQGGDPLSKNPRMASQYGTGGLGLLKAEFTKQPFVRGSVGAARLPSSPDSGGSQLFICLYPQASMAGQYTQLGEVVEGIEVADRIGDAPVNGDKPKARIEIVKATVRE
jgi:cyclophilin family peptidyl-prolyl cis-trans isomerase